MSTTTPENWSPPSTHKYSDPIAKTPFPTTAAPDVKKAAGDLKCPMHLLPPEFLRQTAVALKSGADKYGAYNWRKSGLRLDTYVGAILRHTTSMAEGEWLDPGSGLPHIAMIAANAAVLIDCDYVGKLEGKEGPAA